MKPENLLPGICKTLSSFSEAEMHQFFQSFLTPKEIEKLEVRVALIDLLLRGVPQREISKRLGISFSKITRGSHELQDGVGKKFFPKFFKVHK